VCHKTFGGLRAFDEHRKGGACRDITALGYIEKDGIWRSDRDHGQVAAFLARVRPETLP
jgi:hypothetical protein